MADLLGSGLLTRTEWDWHEMYHVALHQEPASVTLDTRLTVFAVTFVSL